jgi:hypothetical protein
MCYIASLDKYISTMKVVLGISFNIMSNLPLVRNYALRVHEANISHVVSLCDSFFYMHKTY